MGVRDFFLSLLAKADIQINGDRPWDIQVYNEKLFGNVLRRGSLGLGEAYMDGWWDTEALDEFFFRVLRSDIYAQVPKSVVLLGQYLQATLRNQQRLAKAFEIGKHHYDIGNNVYQAMLDKRMTYTCGYWREASILDEAQEAKLDLVCRKLGITKGMKVLDIGCGWGSFARFAAEKYGAHVTGVTVSKEQVQLGGELSKNLPVDIRLQDYRQVEGRYDRIVSLGMFEHVGYKNYATFMEIARRSLVQDGLFLLHTIGNNVSLKVADPWIDRYIFPGGLLPSISRIGGAIEHRFVMEDWHNFGADYDKTLMAWFENFDAAWPRLASQYGDRFYRMWKYYLLSCAGAFRARNIQLWQIVLSPKGVKGGYTSVRRLKMES